MIVDGENIYAKDVDETEVRKRIGLLAQRPTVLPMSIYENVAYGLYIHRMRKDTRAYKDAVRHYLELAGLWEEVGTTPRRRSRLASSSACAWRAGWP